MLINPDNLAASHNAVGYVLPNGGTGYWDDREYGMGRAILRALEQYHDKARGIAVFVTRHYGGRKLGGRRWEITANISKEVIDKELSLRDHVTFLAHGSSQHVLQVVGGTQHQDARLMFQDNQNLPRSKFMISDMDRSNGTQGPPTNGTASRGIGGGSERGAHQDRSAASNQYPLPPRPQRTPRSQRTANRQMQSSSSDIHSAKDAPSQTGNVASMSETQQMDIDILDKSPPMSTKPVAQISDENSRKQTSNADVKNSP